MVSQSGTSLLSRGCGQVKYQVSKLTAHNLSHHHPARNSTETPSNTTLPKPPPCYLDTKISGRWQKEY